ncbi:MAG: hypothetical protein WA434_16410 [Candidatus Acidiferrales bacterium]
MFAGKVRLVECTTLADVVVLPWLAFGIHRGIRAPIVVGYEGIHVSCDWRASVCALGAGVMHRQASGQADECLDKG